MIEQVWIEDEEKRICAVVNNIREKKECNVGVIFLHGFSQTKSGAYGLFSQLCELLNKSIPTIRFDYIGYGDSEGETYEADLFSMLKDAQIVTQWMHKTIKCKKILFVGHGVGNYIATTLAKQNYNSEAILIMPQLRALNKDEQYKNVIRNIDVMGDYQDTNDISIWNDEMDDYFAILGGRMNRSKGIVVSKNFLKQVNAYSIEDTCGCMSNIKAVLRQSDTTCNELIEKLNNYVLFDVLLLDMLEREKVIMSICQYIEKFEGDGDI